MSKERSTLQQELDKLEVGDLERLFKLWNIPKTGKDRRTVIKRLLIGMQDTFYIKGVLEKLSSTQVTIYRTLLSSKGNIMTLGDISRKISLPPANTEIELTVLKRYSLIYQRKNRERLTNTLDRYHCYMENGIHVSLDTNEKNKKFRIHFAKSLLGKEYSPEWRKLLKIKSRLSANFDQKIATLASKPGNIQKLLSSWTLLEKEVIWECFCQGGILEMGRVREIVRSHKKEWEFVVRKLDQSGLLIDDYYVDNKFVRMMLLPQEIFDYLILNPLFLGERKGIQQRQSKQVCNGMDFYLNVKNLIAYISRRGINLAKSGKIKQVDLRETDKVLLRMDTSLFIEKSQIYQVELLLPVMRLLGIVRAKNLDIVLRNEYDKILEMEYLPLMQLVISTVIEERDRRSFYENIFVPLDTPFPDKTLWQECFTYLQKNERIIYSVLMAILIRQKLIFSRHFSIESFPAQLSELRRELTSVLFYLQLLGLINVGYPERWISLSSIGHYHSSKKPFTQKDQPGGIIFNPDMSLIAIPEKISLQSMLLLKSFAHLEAFDNVYTFRISKQSFQNGILLKEKPDELVQLLKQCSRKELKQNFLFSIEEWSKSFPLVHIKDECTVLQTKDIKHMELLLGQINGKRIIQEKIGENTLLIHPNKTSEVIEVAEKLELLIKLIR